MRVLLVIVAVPIAVFLFVVAAWAVYTVPRVSSKGGAPHAAAVPVDQGLQAVPILQLENHTCGYLSLSAAYVSYGLSPEDENLRFRLGVDREAHPFDEASTGTLHPDLLRVLVQDGFEYRIVDPEAVTAGVLLEEHLRDGQAALLLIALANTGNLHWVLADEIDEDGRLRIVDSLEAEPYSEPLSEYLRTRVLSIVAIEPAGDDFSIGVSGAHRAGVVEMARVAQRIQARAGG